MDPKERSRKNEQGILRSCACTNIEVQHQIVEKKKKKEDRNLGKLAKNLTFQED